MALTTVYALDFSNQTKAVAVEAGGNRVLSFVQNPNYALAVWPGGASAAPLLAWGTQPSGDNFNTSLVVSGVDGANLETLLSEPGNTSGPHQLVAERWSADGKSLYFSREPVGIGGYIVFSGASSLYRMEVASRQVTELIPFNVQQGGRMICLDALSGRRPPGGRPLCRQSDHRAGPNDWKGDHHPTTPGRDGLWRLGQCALQPRWEPGRICAG